MNFRIIFLVAVSFSASGCASLKSECGSASYIPFDALLYAAENEESIAERAFYKKAITSEGFSDIINSDFTSDQLGYKKAIQEL
ncbi:hypothetical protein [Pseudomonas anguilliseptica]|uniref:hypothetical protein n=1 Tax=Pseudomonas anguilliseptica TaxID=53406 RepID=UPI00111492AB|nr:hypothetical protein [Pseudomonas anguilliseptica]